MALPDTSKYRNNVGLATKIFAEYGDFIHMVIFSQVKNEARTDDIFQDFFLFLVRKPMPQDVKNIKGYLYRAITNDIIDATRRVNKYSYHVHKYKEYPNHSINKRTPENAFIDVEETNKMLVLIKGRLTNSQYQAMALRYRTDHSIKEVAKKMGVKSTSVSRYISIGLKKIRQSFKLK
jgi:RNA polymerase sigma factor (sigma-70 family)